MGYKQIWLPIKVENFVAVENEKGVWHTHLIIDEKYLSALKALNVYEDWESVPVEYKNKDGGQLHEFIGFSTTQLVEKDGDIVKIRVPIEEEDGYK